MLPFRTEESCSGRKMTATRPAARKAEQGGQESQREGRSFLGKAACVVGN